MGVQRGELRMDELVFRDGAGNSRNDAFLRAGRSSPSLPSPLLSSLLISPPPFLFPSLLSPLPLLSSLTLLSPLFSSPFPTPPLHCPPSSNFFPHLPSSTSPLPLPLSISLRSISVYLWVHNKNTQRQAMRWHHGPARAVQTFTAFAADCGTRTRPRRRLVKWGSRGSGHKQKCSGEEKRQESGAA